MIVCMTRNICAQLYQKIVEKRPEWYSEDDDKGVVKVVISESASDDELLRPHIRSKMRKEKIKGRVTPGLTLLLASLSLIALIYFKRRKIT